MTVKAALFVVASILAGALLVASVESRWLAAALYLVGAWSLARAYYFAFYVITGYCDPSFRYAGVWSALRWVVRHGRARRTSTTPTR